MSYQGKELLQIMQNAKNYNAFVVDLILKSLKDKNKKVLDFGSGYGFFANLLREKGVPDLTCIEIDEELSEHCKSLDFTVFNDLAQIEEQKFDFIYTLNVLEHIEEDEKAILELKNKLKEDGTLFIYVPAFQLLYSSFDKEICHFRRYNKQNLNKFLEKNGFEIQSSKYIDSVGFLLALIFKLINKKQGKITPLQIIIFDRLLFPLGRIFDIATCGKFFGKNLVVEARKKNGCKDA